jgi:hypothetical protein
MWVGYVNGYKSSHHKPGHLTPRLYPFAVYYYRDFYQWTHAHM